MPGVPATPLASGLLVSPKATDAAVPGSATSAPGPGGGPAAAAGAGDLSPRAAGAGDGSGPSAEAAQLGLPEELSLGDLFPTAPADGTAGIADAPAPTVAPDGEAVADYGHAPSSRRPLLAGMGVTLAILALGGAFLWWRNRDRYYWPA